MSKNNKPNLFTLFALLIAFLLPILVIPTINNPFFHTKGLLLFALGIGTLLFYIFQSFKEKKWLISSNPLVLPLLLFGASVILSSLVTHKYAYDQFVGWAGFLLSFVVIIIFAPTLINQNHGLKFIKLLNLTGLIITFNSVLQLFGLGFSQVINHLSIFEFTNDLSFSLTGGALLNIQLLSSLLIANLLSKSLKKTWPQKIMIAGLVFGLGINLYAILPSQEASPVLLPLAASIAIARQSLAVSRTALFGFGPNSYVEAFHLLKPTWFNTTNLWQFSFESATIFPLTLIVSGGLLAFLSWLFLVSRSFKTVLNKRNKQTSSLKYFIIAVMIWQIIAPLNTLMLGLLALSISFYLAANLGNYKIKKFSFNNLFDPFNLQPNNKANKYSFTLISLLFMVSTLFLSYQLGLHYAAQVASYQATAASINEDYSQTFAKQEQTRNLVNRSALWRRIYANSAFELAIALSNKTDITPVEQEQVMELVNLAITEARAATILQPGLYQNWMLLADIYLQLLEVTADAQQLAIESLSQAVLTNPNDPLIRISLGQLFMQFEQWEQAANFFIQAAERKPDLAVAYYNLAQAYIQNQQILEAESALQQALILVDQETNLEDYTLIEEQLAIIKEQADQLRKQIDMQNAQGPEDQMLVDTIPEPSSIDSESVLPIEPVEKDSGLSNLLDEETTSSLLRESRLTPEEETLN